MPDSRALAGWEAELAWMGAAMASDALFTGNAGVRRRPGDRAHPP